MNELKEKLMESLHLDEAMADKAVAMVTEFLKDKLPDNLHGLLDNLGNGEGAGNALDMVKGLFGSK